MDMAEMKKVTEARKVGETLEQVQTRIELQERPPAQLPAVQAVKVPSAPVGATTTTTALAIPEEAGDGLTPDDLVIPRWKITQPTSRDTQAKPGAFYNTLTGESRERLDGVVLLIRKNGRVLFPDNDYSGVRDCWSYDGVAPEHHEIEERTGHGAKSPVCCDGKKAICPLAKWAKDAKGNTVAPPCAETISFCGFDSATMTPFFVVFHGTGLAPVRNLLSAIYLKKKQAEMQGKTCNLRDFRVSLVLKLTVNDRGKFYVPAFEKLEPITDEAERSALGSCFAAVAKRNDLTVEGGDVVDSTVAPAATAPTAPADPSVFTPVMPTAPTKTVSPYAPSATAPAEPELRDTAKPKARPGDTNFLGRVASMPIAKTIKGADPLTTFGISLDEPAADGTEQYNVECWGDVAAVALKLTLAQDICVTGQVKEKTWKDKKGVDQLATALNASGIKLVTQKKLEF
jgi:hypothetical protein